MMGVSQAPCLKGKIYGLVAAGGGRATAVTIAEALLAQTGKEPSMARIYTALDALKKRGVISSAWGPVVPTRNGKRKVYYTATGFDEATSTKSETQAILNDGEGE